MELVKLPIFIGHSEIKMCHEFVPTVIIDMMNSKHTDVYTKVYKACQKVSMNKTYVSPYPLIMDRSGKLYRNINNLDIVSIKDTIGEYSMVFLLPKKAENKGLEIATKYGLKLYSNG